MYILDCGGVDCVSGGGGGGGGGRGRCNCPCSEPDVSIVNLTTSELTTLVERLKEEIRVDKKQLSSNIRRKTSAPDARPSSKYIGTLGIVLLTSLGISIVAADAKTILLHLKIMKRNICN